MPTKQKPPKQKQPRSISPRGMGQVSGAGTTPKVQQSRSFEQDVANLDKLPTTYQELVTYLMTVQEMDPWPLRRETLLRIEKIRGRPIICYVAQTHSLPNEVPTDINDLDLIGFADLIRPIEGDKVDVFIVSNGGVAETTERIVNLLRGRFKSVSFIVPANAFSAATLLCFSGDEIIMNSIGTLGPIDPQFSGIPARAIRRAFEELEKKLKDEGPEGLTAYLPLLEKYDLHLLEMCKSAEDLSKELARTWVSKYMLKCGEDDPRVNEIIDFFTDYDKRRSHGRSVYRDTVRELGLKVVYTEEIDGLADLVHSLYLQYELGFDKSAFFKFYENAHGINWGRQIEVRAISASPSPLTPPPAGQPETSG